MRRVVVTGLGLVTPLGGDVETTWSNLIAGKSGIGRITRYLAAIFGEVQATDVSGEMIRQAKERLE